jgi:nitroreductase / dihydropteridine reductase
MTPITEEQLVESMTWRCAVRKFDTSKKVSEKQLNALLESLRLTASSCGLQPWKFVVVEDPAIKKQLREKSLGGQACIEEASHVIVLSRMIQIPEGYIDTYTDHLAGRWKLPSIKKDILAYINSKSDVERPYWITHQIYIALGNLMTSCALLGIDALPMEGIIPRAYDEILGLRDEGYTSVLMTLIGFRHEADIFSKLPKDRWPLERIVKKL